MKPKVCVLRTDGTNCDRETKYAFNEVGGDAEIVHLNSIIKGYDPAENRQVSLDQFDILAIPGGFSYGDYIGSGKIFVVDLKHFLEDKINDFIDKRKPVIGICNGFQVLVKYGLLPRVNGEIKQTTTLTYNDSGRFECRWVKLVQPRESKCIWTKGISSIDLPVAHGEGKFVAPPDLIQRLFDEDQVVFQYANSSGIATTNYPDNPNGSIQAIAGICDPTGLIFGLMPHPERYNRPMNHRLATLQKIKGTLPDHGLGLDIFRNGVDYCRG
ncbi:MAG: phosphoribosylformylglycinamidine synthase I [Nanoarchaeota archaeon]|nr:phosphoribosylformylglycinamidine synthase I [Nanoarchaeota archaeon]